MPILGSVLQRGRAHEAARPPMLTPAQGFGSLGSLGLEPRLATYHLIPHTQAIEFLSLHSVL